MQGLHLRGAQGLGLAQRIRGDRQPQQKNRGRTRQAPMGRQTIHGQCCQVDEPQPQKETARQQGAFQVSVGLGHHHQQSDHPPKPQPSVAILLP